MNNLQSGMFYECRLWYFVYRWNLYVFVVVVVVFQLSVGRTVVGCCAVGAIDVNVGVVESVAEFLARDVGLGGVVAGVGAERGR